MPKELNFYDVKARKKFTTNKYKIVSRMVKGNKRKFAIAKSPHSDIKGSWRVLWKN